MRTSNLIASIALLGVAVVGIALSPAISFDGTRAPEGAAAALPEATPSPTAGSPSLGGATPLAAVPGVPGAIWKLGRMYADGDGVKTDKARAYEYFRRLTTMHGDDSATAPNARFVANAFVTLGLYYLDGIPGTLKADPNLAREMFRYAASYFADPEAQYHLGRLYLLGKGAPKDAIQAARWLRLSANKGDHRAQALLGGMLFKGEEVSRQAALGLFWLIVAKDAARPDEAWITDMYANALAQANESERAMARKYLEDWLKNRRE